MLFRTIITALALTLAGVAVACGDDDDDGDRTPVATLQPTFAGNPTPAPTDAPAGTPTATAGGTGIASIDAALAALEAGDIAALRAQLQLEAIACVAEPEGIGGPPICEAGEAEGTPVEVLALAQCEGSYGRAPELDAALTRFVAQGVELYAVYRTPDPYFPDGDYAIVVSVDDPDAVGAAREVVLNDAGIVGLNYGCAETPEQLVQTRRLTDAIIAPG